MAIQSINLGALPDGKGGDTLRSTATKINENFSNAAHAASKLVGTARNNIPLAQEVFKAAAIGEWVNLTDTTVYASVDDFPVGSQFSINTSSLATLANTPNGFGTHIWGISTVSTGISASMVMQIAVSQYGKAVMVFRVKGISLAYGEWQPIGYSPITYTTTTASGANVVVDTTGKLMRSTSSERYKDIIAPLVLTDEVYNNAITLKPIVYRSTAEADNPLHHYYSFSAEQLGAFDKAFTLWRDTEIKEVIKLDEEGREYRVIEEVTLAEPLAEGLNINALLAFSHAISVKQASIINKLEARLEALEDALAPKEV